MAQTEGEKPLKGSQGMIMGQAQQAETLLPSSFSGWEPKRLWHVQGDGGFEETAYAEGFDSRLDGRSLVPADIDGDGDQELLMLSRAGQRLQLFENVAAGGHAIELELRAAKGSRDADGVLVRAEGLGIFNATLTRGYSSSVPPTVHLGLGTRAQVPVEVQWRGGQREAFGALKAGARYVLEEGKGRPGVTTPFAVARVAPPPAWPSTLQSLGLEPSKVPTLVQLFTRGCKPCAEEAPVLARLKGVKVLGLGLVAEGGSVEKDAASLGITYPVRALPATIAEALERSGELPLPLLLVYGAEGRLARVVPGLKQLDPVLKELKQ